MRILPTGEEILLKIVKMSLYLACASLQSHSPGHGVVLTGIFGLASLFKTYPLALVA